MDGVAEEGGCRVAEDTTWVRLTGRTAWQWTNRWGGNEPRVCVCTHTHLGCSAIRHRHNNRNQAFAPSSERTSHPSTHSILSVTLPGR